VTPETNAPEYGHAVKLPDEVWSSALASGRVSWAGLSANVRLLDGSIYEDMHISNRGYVLGRHMEGLAGAHGGIDSTMLSFTTPDIEGVRIGRRHFWQRPIWVLINPEHPARRAFHGGHFSPPPQRKKTLPPISTIIIVTLFFGGIGVGTILAVIGLSYMCGWLR
jgi:hypothetical protein